MAIFINVVLPGGEAAAVTAAIAAYAMIVLGPATFNATAGAPGEAAMAEEIAACRSWLQAQ